MDPSIYRKKWHKLRDGKADPDELHHLARRIAFSFIDKHFQSGSYVAEYIDLLCEMATFYSKAELSNIASTALFEIVVEKLCDDFEDLPVEVYSRVMCQVISYCRTVPAGKSLDAQLTDFGIVLARGAATGARWPPIPASIAATRASRPAGSFCCPA